MTPKHPGRPPTAPSADEVLQYIAENTRTVLIPPSTREIGKHFGVSHPPIIAVINKLVEQNLLTKTEHGAIPAQDNPPGNTPTPANTSPSHRPTRGVRSAWSAGRGVIRKTGENI